MKKTISLLLSLALLLSLSVPALAETWQTDEFSIEIPDGMYRLSSDLPEDDPAWALAGVADPSSKIQDYLDMGVLVNFVSQDKGTSISLMKRTSDYAVQVHNLSLLDAEQRDKVLSDLVESNNEDLTISKDWFPAGDLLFYRVRLDMAGESPLHELLYGTIINGYALNIDIFGGDEPISPQQEAMMEDLVRSIRFTNITEKPLPDPINLTGTIALLILLLVSIIVPLVYMPVKSKRDKREKARLAEQLSEYHRTHGANEAQGEPLFMNDTDCTKEAIHSFSFFQAYVKNMGELAFGALMCLVMLSTSFFLDTEWWMKLIAAGVTVYYAYKIIAMPGAVEKVQLKVYGRGPSQTAHYIFYPEVFRVSGIQSTSVVPYFQITDLRRRGQYLYLYYGPDNAYMVDLYGFTQGEAQDFQAFIRDKTGKK